MAPTMDVYEDAAGEYRWRLVAGNGEIIADSGEGYATRWNATRAVDTVSTVAESADRLDFGRVHFEVYKDQAGEYRWRLITDGGRIIAVPGEGYSAKSGANRAVDRTRKYADDPDRYGVYEDQAGEYRWRMKAPNGRVIAVSNRSYSRKQTATDAVERVRNLAPNADRLQGPHFEVYEDRAGEYRWRLVAGNGRIIADSGEGYASKSGADKAIDRLQVASRQPPTLAVPLGFEIKESGDHRVESLLEADVDLPVAIEREDLTTIADNQSKVTIRLLAGAGPDPDSTDLLTTATLRGVSPQPAGEPRFHLRCAVDADGTAVIAVTDPGRERTAEATADISELLSE